MASGTTGPVPQGPYPTYAPVYQPPHKQPVEYVRTFASDFVLAIGVVIGLFLMMIGEIVTGWADTADGRDAGSTVRAFGMFFLTAVMFLGGLLRHDMEKWVRWALIIGATALLIFGGFWGAWSLITM